MSLGLTYFGSPIYWSEYATQDGAPEVVRRTWRVRLFTRPWRPLRATYTRIPKVPAMYTVGGVVVVHPALRPELERLFATQKNK